MASYKRTERVSRLLQEEVSKIIQQEIKDPKIGFVTVTKAEISPDLQQVKVFISIYGDDKSMQKSMQVLDKAKPFIRREIGRRIKLRYTPDIHFRYDETAEKASRIFKLLNELKSEKRGD